MRIANQIQENGMTSVKISAIALAISAMLAGPVLAQGTSQSAVGSRVQGRTSLQGGATSGTVYEQLNRQIGAPAETAGVARPGVVSPAGTGAPMAATGGRR
jgi:hypothetical protein